MASLQRNQRFALIENKDIAIGSKHNDVDIDWSVQCTQTYEHSNTSQGEQSVKHHQGIWYHIIALCHHRSWPFHLQKTKQRPTKKNCYEVDFSPNFSACFNRVTEVIVHI